MQERRVGPAAVFIAVLILLAALGGTVGLGGAGWVIGVICGAGLALALSFGMDAYGCERLGPATWVTLLRGALAVGVAALTAESFGGESSVAAVVGLSSVALALDGVDGWVARRTGSSSRFGAKLDGECDAFLMLVLSVFVARQVGWWVLAIGAMRYAFLAGGWVWPWLQRQLPPRDWRKVVTATQGIVLVAAAAEILPRTLTQIVVALALVMLTESFGRDVVWLWRRRAEPREAPAAGETGTGRGRQALALVVTIAAVVLFHIALVLPNRTLDLGPATLLRIPVEGVALVGLAAIMTVGRRAFAWLAGVGIGLLLMVKVLDMGFWSALDRPFNPVEDWSYAGIGLETLRDSIGSGQANLLVAGGAVLLVAVIVLPALATVRVARLAATHQRRSLQVAAVLGATWLLLFAVGASGASRRTASAAVHEVTAVRDGLRGRAAFAREIRIDAYRDVPAEQLLTGLRGKDVLLVFVESYGKVALQDPAIAPGVEALLDAGMAELRSAGFAARTGYLTSSTFGGISWLAHATVHSGAWVDNQRRYNQLTTSDRFTLSKAFKRAGWRTVDIVPANNRAWPEGSTFYGFDKIYDQRNLGYRGPRFGYPSMPDQYAFHALHRDELARRPRTPIFAELDLVSSHLPWSRIPALTDWGQLGDGSIFHTLPIDEETPQAVLGDRALARERYGRAITYTMRALFSFVARYGTDDTVVIAIGDHQPNTLITGQDASHDVPISVIARDPKVLARIAEWRWDPGMKPGDGAPVWRMDVFRDRFLSAFGE